MASTTAKITLIRKRKKTKMGKERKRKLRKEGSTPKFPIHLEESKKP